MSHSFSELIEPVTKEVILAYYDLRKFSSIESGSSADEIYQILNKMHEIITDGIENQNGYALRYIGDNCLAVYESNCLQGVLEEAKSIKVQVDEYFRVLGKPSVLHVLIHCGAGNIGMLGGRSNKRVDVSGPVLNEIGYHMMRVDTSGNGRLFNSLCMSKTTADKIDTLSCLSEVKVADCEFCILA